MASQDTHVGMTWWRVMMDIANAAEHITCKDCISRLAVLLDHITSGLEKAHQKTSADNEGD